MKYMVNGAYPNSQQTRVLLSVSNMHFMKFGGDLLGWLLLAMWLPQLLIHTKMNKTK